MLTVGQKLWLVPNRGHGEPREITITRIGRVWAYSDRGWGREEKIHQETLHVEDRDFVYAHCYLSQEEYETKEKSKDVWNDFHRRLSWGYPPKGVTTERIREIAEEFGIKLEIK